MKNRKKLTFSTIFSNLKDLLISIKEAVKNKPFMRLCGATFLVFNGYQIVASFSFFIFVFYIFNGSYEATSTWPAWFSSIGALVSAFFVIHFMFWIFKTAAASTRRRLNGTTQKEAESRMRHNPLNPEWGWIDQAWTVHKSKDWRVKVDVFPSSQSLGIVYYRKTRY